MYINIPTAGGVRKRDGVGMGVASRKVRNFGNQEFAGMCNKSRYVYCTVSGKEKEHFDQSSGLPQEKERERADSLVC